MQSASASSKLDAITCIAYESKCALHKCPNGRCSEESHPECPERLQIIYDQLSEDGLVPRCLPLESRRAKLEELTLVHDEAYVRELARTKHMNVNELTAWKAKWNSVCANKKTWEAATWSCGNLLQCVDAVIEGRAVNGVAVIRPPGHHAELSVPKGFCFINNVAVAAQYARKRFSRILIMDWDVHHGNGTQSAFWKDPSVLYISIHRYDQGKFYPKTEEGNYTKIGEGAGRGYNVNIPWNAGKKEKYGDPEYLEAFKRIVMPIASEFDPELVLVSAGFDAAPGDIGGYQVTPYCYAQMTKMLSALANGRIILALEGGYNLTQYSVGICMSACVHVLLGGEPVGPNETIKESANTARDTIQNVIGVLSEYWSSIRPGTMVADLRETNIDESDHANTKRRHVDLAMSKQREPRSKDSTWLWVAIVAITIAFAGFSVFAFVEISSLNDQVSSLNDQVSSLNDQVSSLNDQVSSLNDQIKLISWQLKAIQEQNLSWQLKTSQSCSLPWEQYKYMVDFKLSISVDEDKRFQKLMKHHKFPNARLAFENMLLVLEKQFGGEEDNVNEDVKTAEMRKVEKAMDDPNLGGDTEKRGEGGQAVGRARRT